MSTRRLAVLSWFACLSLLGSGLAADPPPSAAAATPQSAQKQPLEVRVLRLQHGDAATVVNSLSSVLDTRTVRLATWPGSNSVVVAAPADLQKDLERLISLLDRPQESEKTSVQEPSKSAIQERIVGTNASHGPDAGYSASPPADVPERKSRSLAGTSSDNEDQSTIAVVTASPATQSVIAELFARHQNLRSARTPASQNPPQSAPNLAPRSTGNVAPGPWPATAVPPASSSPRVGRGETAIFVVDPVVAENLLQALESRYGGARYTVGRRYPTAPRQLPRFNPAQPPNPSATFPEASRR